MNAFEKLGVLYYIGGSVASSAYGIARATMDVDMVSNLKPDHVHALVEMLESSYYIDEEMILDAIQSYSTFNLIHLDTMLKVDIFIMKDTPYHKESLKRRKKDVLDEGQGNIEFYLVSPEDIIINKLEWYHIGGEVSETQWRDVTGVLKVQGDLLDVKYLRHWASQLKLIDLLEEAFHDAGFE
ncbi:hypothetical protein K8R14_05405 [bacterium]|nr:hypothetical protein [bacterium]